MPAQIMNGGNLGDLLKTGIVFVDWWAPWCGPCRVFAPIFDKVADDNPGLVFAKVDADEHADVAESFGIRSIPTLMIFRDGILVFRQVGAMTEQALQTLASRVQELDMEQVRSKLAEHDWAQN